jgi:uncharacterized membrane protein
MSAAKPKSRHSFASDFRRHFLAGLFVVIPIVVTVWVVFYLFGLLSDLGKPLVDSIVNTTTSQQQITDRAELYTHLKASREHLQSLEDGLATKPAAGWTDVAIKRLIVFKDILAFLLVVVIIYLLGWAANRVLGKRVLTYFDAIMERIPLVKSIYGMMKQLLSTFQQRPEGVERVVLINFPTDRMKTVGLVMKTFSDVDTGRRLAAVYVPTAPNPTSGYLELVPMEDIINTDWTVDEAMRFIVSGGAVGPETINYDKSATPKPRPAPTVTSLE